MTNLDFDILLNYGGGEDGTSSWIQERQIAASRGQLDNEPHIVGTDAMMYPDLKEGEVPYSGWMQGLKIMKTAPKFSKISKILPKSQQ